MEIPGYTATCVSRSEWDGTNPANLVCTGSTTPRSRYTHAHAHSSESARTTKSVAARQEAGKRGSPHMTGGAGDVRPSFWPGASRATKLCKLGLEYVVGCWLALSSFPAHRYQTLLGCRSRLIGDGPPRSPLTPRATVCMTPSSRAPIASQAVPYFRSAALRA
jgi:hypothetical protein